MSGDPSDVEGTEGSQVTAELNRELTLFHITIIGVGTIPGDGVFVGTAITIGTRHSHRSANGPIRIEGCRIRCGHGGRG